MAGLVPAIHVFWCAWL